MATNALEKAIALHLEKVLGAWPEITIYTDREAEPFTVYIGKVADYPADGMVTLSTIGAANHPVIQEDGSEFAARLEFIGSCKADQETDFAEALFMAARYIGPVRGEACPGMFLHGLFAAFRPQSPVPHALLDYPFAYDRLLDVKEFAGIRVTWLQLVPVSTAEIALAQAQSTDALRDAFEAADIAWEDLDRASIR